MAATQPTSLSFSIDSTLQPLLHNHHHSSHLPTINSLPTSPSSPLLSIHNHHKSHPFTLKSFFPSSSPPTAAVESPPRAGPFLDATGIERHQTLNEFHHTHLFDHGRLEIRKIREEEIDTTVQLLAESFAESMWMPDKYVSLLAFLVKKYVQERQLLVPNAAMLVGFYSENGSEDKQLVCTAEISFDALGANAALPTPLPPKDCPYICNMTVKKTLRRRGIGWELLNTCEKLILQMKTTKRVYLHCRVVDTGPFNMYKKACYKVVKTDSILIWLSLQRRKHLMYKELPAPDDHLSDALDFNNHPI